MTYYFRFAWVVNRLQSCRFAGQGVSCVRIGPRVGFDGRHRIESITLDAPRAESSARKDEPIMERAEMGRRKCKACLN